MLDVTLLYILTGATGAMAAFVAARAWAFLPARLFVAVCTSLLLTRLLGDIRDVTSAPALVPILSAVSIAFVVVLQLCLLLLFASLFAPTWLTGRRPALWIALPYALAGLLLLADGALGLGLIFKGLRETSEGVRLAPAPPGSTIMLAAFTLSWGVHLGLLAVALVRQPESRGGVGLLAGSLILAMAAGFVTAGGILQFLPILAALAYIVLRTSLLLPTRVGIDAAVAALEDPVLVLDSAGALAFANPAAAALGLDRPAGLRDASAVADGGTASLGGRELQMRNRPLADRAGRAIGTLLLGRDITDVRGRERQLEAERAQLAEAVARLTAAQAERAELAQAVQQLTMPLIPALPGVLIMPLVGSFDGPRIEEFSATLLGGVEREGARLVLLDITGLPLLDTAGAAGLLRGVRAAALLGARCVLVGVRPEIAQSLVGLGVDLREIGTAATMQQALISEMRPTVARA